MKQGLWKTSGAPYLFVFGVLMAMITAGCAQNGDGGGQPSGGQTAVTEERGTTAAEATAGEESTAQRAQDNGRGDTTAREQGRTQQRQSTREQQPSDQQGEQQTITVRITGTQGLAFAGRVGTAQDRGRVQGSVPEEFEVPFEGAAVTAVVRKQEPGGGTLRVEVVRDGRVVASRETSTSTGVVNVVWTSGEEPDGSGG